MSAEHSVEEQKIRSQVDESERHLDDLERKLRDVDGELETLAEQNHRYEVLEQACRSLEELEGLGAAELFWGARDGAQDTQAYVTEARKRIGEFAEEIAQVEERRQAIVDKIGAQNDVLDYLHYDLRDAMQRAESQRHEWLIEREESELPSRTQVMPWARGCEEDRRFRKSLGMSLAASLLLALIVSSIVIPIPELEPIDELPERMARLVRQERPQPPPVAEQVPLPEDKPEPEPDDV
ncbi:MAG: hypothetical protein R3288_04450, partial [Woeseiaceae bacterium]|nr:hypothetical protein [Woeseiaceae bacterium]